MNVTQRAQPIFAVRSNTKKCGSQPPLVEQKVEQVRTIIGTMHEHNEQCRALVGKDFTLITVRRYESCTRYLAELIKLKYDKEDLPITEVSGELVRAFNPTFTPKIIFSNF